MRVHAKNLEKPRKNLGKIVVFAHAELFRMTCPHARKVSQNMFLEPPKPSPDPPRTLQNRAWSAPRCYKSGQDAPKVPKKGIRSAQERENGAQERKMCQHGPNMVDFDLVFGRSWQVLSISSRFGAWPWLFVAQDPPQTLPEPSKIEPGALQDVILKHDLT